MTVFYAVPVSQLFQLQLSLTQSFLKGATILPIDFL